MTLVVMADHSARAVTPLGQDVVNVANLTYEQDGRGVSLQTNAATFTVVARPTPSTIEFLRVVPGASEGELANLNGSDFSPSGSADPSQFLPEAPPFRMDGTPLDTSGPVSLVAAERFFPGELVIVCVEDLGQNGDPSAIETLIITVRSSAGDEVILRLYESGPDTGRFYAWLPSADGPAEPNDGVLSAPQNAQLTATYVDPFDATEISVDTALVDPFGRLFDSLTGELLDGASVTLVEADTGAPAEVFGIDGVSAFPSTVTTGGTVTDESGRLYELAPGAFLFPLTAPGDYRLLVTPPEEYAFPSGIPAEGLSDLPNGPFVVIEGSYGAAFTVSATGPLNFDVPLDTSRGLAVIKRAGAASAAIGDFISYTVEVENRETGSLPLLIKDLLPRGMRYVDGSARFGDDDVPGAEIGPAGQTVTFDMGRIEPGETVQLSYVLAVGPGTTLGTAENAALAVTPFGMALSNTAKAFVRIEEDLLRSEGFIIGRVASGACDGEADWAREVRDGIGVAGVRLYMETGDYVVSDEDGLFHFEGVSPGTHVVQVDTATLPSGFTPMVCEETSRYAGSAVSKFVDVRGGAVWRANFYLSEDPGAAAAQAGLEPGEDGEDAAAVFDIAWLDQQPPGLAWAYPAPDVSPAQRSVSIGIHGPDRASMELYLNGRPVPALNTQRRLTSSDGAQSLFRWRGVDIEPGENLFEARVTHSDGRIETLTRSIWFVDSAQRVRLVDDQSVLVADGRTPPVLALRLEDAGGRRVHAGLVVDVEVNAPYRKLSEAELEASNAVARPEIDGTGAAVDADGIVRIELEPTLQTGLVRLSVPLQNGRVEEISAYLRPEKRDWILVGLAEAEGGYLNTDAASPVSEDDLYTDGRVALFAKGMVRGEWLMTLAIDTAKRRGGRDESLFDEIDPNAYYTLYGDRSAQYQEAPSQYPVYVKMERETAQIVFGDFNTDLRDSQLATYSRRLSGLRAQHEGDRLSATGFAAETNQGFVKDEIPADGTSGPYRLSQAPIVRGSEEITVEARDRTRPDTIVARRRLVRFVDYDIDYDTGRLLMRAPVDAVDSAFNEQVIVVDYEAVADVERNLTYGGRAALKLAEGGAELGLTHIHEDGSAVSGDAENSLSGIDLSGTLGEQTQYRAEYATSTRRPGEDGQSEVSGDAWLLEVAHQRQGLAVRAYAREEEAGFGLGQTGTNTLGVRRLGAELSAVVGERIDADTGLRRTRSINASGYMEDSLASDASRQVADLSFQQASALSSLSVGLRHVNETVDEAPRESVLATANASRTFPAWGLTVLAAHDQPLGALNSDEVSLFPGRTVFGVDKQITRLATLNVRHETLDGINASGTNTGVGVTLLPWAGARVTSGLNEVSQDSARRLSATIGVDQTVRLNDAWSFSLGAADRSRVDGDGAPRDPFADAAVSPLAEGVRSELTADESFTSAYLGAAYRTPAEIVSLRGEMRESLGSTRYAAIFGAARELSGDLSYATSVRYQTETGGALGTRKTLDARLGLALRPRDAGTTAVNRLDVSAAEQGAGIRDWRVVNNFAANTMLTERTQLAGFLGTKYAETRLGGVRVSGWTHLIGGELRHDVTERVDIGLHGLVMDGEASETREYAFGPSVGLSPKDDLWISVGYNVVGFSDRDFEAAEYADQGIYVKLRLKFGQQDVGGMLGRIGLS
ncbi:MAG: hypothetical protein AAF486_02805 [Pseudomonadota bacterium]